MPIDSTLPPRSQGILRDVSLFPLKKEPILIAQKMLHQLELSGGTKVIDANHLDPTKKRHLEERAGSTFHKKMRTEELSVPVESASKPKSVRKRGKVERPVITEWGFEPPQNKCEQARKTFCRALMYESMRPGNTKWLSNNIYIIASGQLNAQKKRILHIQAFDWIKEKHPAASLRFTWVDIPEGTLYAPNNFMKIEDALYGIPFHSRILIHEGNRLVASKKQKPLAGKKPRKSIADKVIVFDPHGSPVIYGLFKSSQLRNPYVEHHYITTGSSLEPFNRLTARSQVYFSNKDELTMQSAKMLTARGFRVIHSFKK